MRRGERLVVLSVASVAILGCSMQSMSSQPQARLGADIVVGVPLAVTGNLSQEGAMAKQGYDLWLDWVNGTRGGIEVQGIRHRVRLDYRDDTSLPEVARPPPHPMRTEGRA